MFRIKKIYRIAVFLLLAFCTLLLLASAVFSLFYEKAAIGYLQKYFNDHLLTEASMEKINIRLLAGFPNVTLEVKNLVLLSGEDFSAGDFMPAASADTLMTAEKITFRFNFVKILRQSYELKKIYIKNGYLNLLTDSHGHVNTKIWDSGTGQNAGNSVHLSNIDLDFVDIRYIDLQNGMELNTRGDRIKLRGSLSTDNITAFADGNLQLYYLSNSGNILLDNRRLAFDVSVKYSGDSLVINDSRLNIDNVPLSFSSLFEESGYSIDITLDDINAGDLVRILPIDKDFTDKYEFSGRLSGKATITGNKGSGKGSLTSSFKVSGGVISNTFNNSELKRIEFNGNASGLIPGNIKISLNDFNSSFGNGTLYAEYDTQIKYNLLTTINSTIDLKEITSFFSGKPLAEGIANAINVQAEISPVKTTSPFEFVRYINSGRVTFKDISVHLTDGADFEHMSGDVTYDGNEYSIDTASLETADNTYFIKGTVNNLYNYLANKEMLNAALDIRLNTLDITGYFTESDESGDDDNDIIPPRLNVTATVYAGNFIVNKFSADDLEMKIHLLNNKVNFNSFNVRFFDGFISGNATIEMLTQGGYSITCNTNNRNVNIRELFTAFNNFAQSFILDKNMQGKLDGTVSFYSEWDANNNLMPEKISALGNISISNGELIDFEPMMQLSKYCDAKELEHVRFSTLKNIINIKNSIVIIPEMTINSSAFNIIASGTHSFENKFDYRLKVLLSEVLFNRARSKRKEINEFSIKRNIEDRFTIPLVFTGTPDNYDVHLDRQRAFSLAGEDNDVKSDPLKEESPKDFIIEWDDAPDTVKPARNKTNENDFIIDW